MVTNLKDRVGGTICNTHLVGSITLNKILNTQKLYDKWRKKNTQKIEFTYHRPKSDIHSRLDRIYTSHIFNPINPINNTILYFTFPVLRP